MEYNEIAAKRRKKLKSYCFYALLYPVLLAGGEDLTQRRRESQRVLLLCVSPRSSALLSVRICAARANSLGPM